MGSDEASKRREGERPGESARHHLLGAALIFGAAFAAYLNNLANGFVYDDRYIVEQNPAVQQLDWRALITSSYWGELVPAGLYRPLTLLSFALNRAVGGPEPLGFHLVNNLLHALASTLVYFLAISLRAGRVASLAGALLFAVHPVHSEAVNGIVGRSEILAFLFAAASLQVFASARLNPARSRALGEGTVFLLFLLALLSKETAAFALPLFPLSELLLAGRIRLRGYGALATTLVVYLFIRWVVLDGLGMGERVIGFLDNPAAHAPALTRFLTAPVVFGKYLLLMVAPFKLSADYSFNQLPLPASLFDLRVLAGLATAIGLGWAAVFAWGRGNRLVSFSIAALALPLVGVSHLFFPLGTLLAERLTYLPSLGACLLAGVGFGGLSARKPRAGYALLAFLLVFFLGLTVRRNRDWVDNETLFRRTVETSAASARSHFLLGTALSEKRDFAGAADSFRRGLAIRPGHLEALMSLGEALLAAGDWEEAASVFREASLRSPSLASAHRGWALSLYKGGRLEEALEEVEKAAQLEPGSKPSQSALGLIAVEAGRESARRGDIGRALDLFRKSFAAEPAAAAANEAGIALALLGRPLEAESWHRRALELEPDNALALNYLGVLEERRRRRNRAKDLYQKALAADPDLVPALLNLGSILMREGDLPGAENLLRRATILAPLSYEAHNSLGIALAGLGHKEEAAQEFRKAISIDPGLRAARDNLSALAGSRK